ncbi:LysR family transcriptional regulator [Roseateles sp. BYS87W]|uniref:LysR family transcriptional regulator n=1 Tax=Pelomonas baiyunensis TaxID=3299026 RepID=A0ABW7H278_9BURK
MSTKNGPNALVTRRRQTAAEHALDANALELFARIAQAGSFAQAARDLGLTRAAISRRIAAIETAVGLTLFARSTRSLGLTEAGRRLHARARAVRDAAEGARLALRHTRDQLDGTLRISATAGFGRHVLTPLLARFQQQHPAVRFELFFTDRRVDLLREGLDIAFRVTSAPPEAWVAQPVLHFQVRAYGPRNLPLLNSPRELVSEAVLLLGQGEEPFVSQWQHEDGRTEQVTLQASTWGSDLDGLIALSLHGAGTVMAPDFCVEPAVAPADLHRGSAATLPSTSSMQNRLPGWRMMLGLETVQALTLPLPAGSETARALVRFIREALGGSSTGRHSGTRSVG